MERNERRTPQKRRKKNTLPNEIGILFLLLAYGLNINENMFIRTILELNYKESEQETYHTITGSFSKNLSLKPFRIFS